MEGTEWRAEDSHPGYTVTIINYDESNSDTIIFGGPNAYDWMKQVMEANGQTVPPELAPEVEEVEMVEESA